MNTSVEDAGPCRKTLHVNVAWDEVAADYAELLKAYATVAAVPGFRKGKAPAGVVEKRYAKQITEDAKERLVPRFYQDAVKAEELEPVAVIGVNQVQFAPSNPFKFDVTVDVAPTFKLPKYAKFALKDETAEIGEKEIDDAIDSVRGRMARFEDVEGRAVQEGDLAQIDYHGESEGTPLSELASDCSGLGDATGFWAMVGEPEFIPGVARGIAGMEVGETKVIDIQFGDDFHVPAVAGKKAAYEVTVKGIRERELPAIDEDFLKNFNVDSVEALRERVVSELRESGEATEKNRRREELSKFLIEKTSFDPPQSLVERETRHVFYTMARNMMRQGLTHEAMQERRQQIATEAARLGEQRVRLTFILKAIAGELEVDVTDADVEQRIQEMAQSHRMPHEQLKAQIEERNGMSDLRDDVLCDRTMERLLEMIRIK